MVRVLHVSTSGDIAGGAEHSLLELLTREKSLGVDPTVLVPHSGSLVSELDRLGVPVIRIRYFSWLEWVRQSTLRRYAVRFIKGACNIVAEYRIKRVLGRAAIDVLHINTSATAAGAMSARKLNVPVVWHVREFNSPASGRVFAHPRQQMGRIAGAEVVIAVSKVAAAPYLQYRRGETVKVIYDAVEPPTRVRDIGDLLSSEPYRLAVVGSVMPSKGQLDALRALKLVRDNSGHRPVLSLVGPFVDPAYEKEIKSFVRDAELSDQVRFAGKVADVYAELLLADVLIVSSRSESFGRATVEGMLAGCLVVGAKNTGTEELLMNGRGFLYEQGSMGLAQQLIAAFTDVERAKATAAKGQSFGTRMSNQMRSTREFVAAVEEARNGQR